MKLRMKFEKSGSMKFVGHLDLMRYFQKAMRRAGIDMQLSAGYSPHMIMSFAAPLALGETSEGEYLDFSCNTAVSSGQMVKALNDTMAEGVQIREIVRLPDSAKSAMSLLYAADYRVSVREGHNKPSVIFSDLSRSIEKFLQEPSVIVRKKTKKSEKEQNILPFILIMMKDPDVPDAIFMRLRTGSEENLKPETVMEALYSFYQVLPEEFDFVVHRIEMYAKEEDVLIPLIAMGEKFESETNLNKG